MFNIERYSKTLELDKVLSLLAEEATLSDASTAALQLVPSPDFSEVTTRLKHTEDAFLLTARYASPNFGRAVAVAPFLTRAAAGGTLNMKEFLQLAETLRCIRGVKDWRANCSETAKTSLDDLFSGLYPNKYLEDKILFCIKSEDEMSDHASNELFSLRRKMGAASLNVRTRLENIVRSASKSKYLQETLITQRDGRYVVPVKAEYRNEVPGIVHDSSASGATLFVEPMTVVEINNELRVLKVKEQEEIDRILAELSAEAATFCDVTVSSYDALVRLNLIFAMASLGYKMKATVPVLNNHGVIQLHGARHPLIDPNRVVPISVELGGTYHSLIITGPNTGGKTVTLKTIGLLTLMTMCGLMIPATDRSEISVFHEILVDIGDEQSIEQSLSTFSSHITNIIDILRVADRCSLVLLDELGGGTDPVEGAALAKAILYHLHRRDVRTVATTHYSELKTYALDTPGVENACCEFDVDTLAPTYRLLIGVPGGSNAFAIASSLGIEQSVIDEAKTYLSDEDIRFERVVASVEKTRKELENEKREAELLRIKLAEEKSLLDKKLSDIETKHEATLQKARAEATRILDRTRAEADLMLNQLETAKKELTAVQAAETLKEARLSVKKGLADMENIADPIHESDDEEYVLPRPLKKGDSVLIVDLQKNAIVTEIDDKDGRCYVTTGSLKLWVNISKLRLLNHKAVDTQKKTRTIRRGETKQAFGERSASSEIDIRGMNADEGIMEVDRYIDHAVMTGLGSVTIIHGKGTGVLRAAIQAHLRRHSNVAAFRLGTFGEGESGVTIVELKK